VKRAAILKKKRKDIVFRQAAELFLQWTQANRKPKTLKCYGEFFGQLTEFFGGKNLSSIHPFLIEKYKRKRLNEGAKVAVNRELSCLKNIFNRCIEWKKFEGANPVKGIQMVKETRGRTRWLNHDEEDMLRAGASEPARTIILVGIYAGLRVRSEALTLKKVDVDFRSRTLTVQAAHAKNGETKTVPLSSELIEPLKQQMKRSQSEYVFVKEDGVTPLKEIKTAFYAACRRAKLTDVTPHVLRHTFASRLVMNGADLRTVQELGGWKSMSMVERYSHLSDRHKAEAVELIGRKYFTTLSTTPQNTEIAELPQVVEK
jgi:integrase